MPNIFLASDHHFSHAGVIKFFREDGVTVLRDFATTEEMNEHMIAQHNQVVGKNDKVYMLGDVAFNKKGLANVGKLNGNKVLIKGNHDKESLNEYIKYFQDIRGSHQFDGMVLTHIPVHPNSLSRWPINVHGHLHSNVVTIEGTKTPDPRYYCVSMEQLDDYTPVSLEELKLRIKNRLEASAES